MADRAYLDWNASAPLLPQARTAMIAALGRSGNPSSVHAEGRAARHVIDDARAKVAALVGADPATVVFTSGGTEANALALSPIAGTRGARLLVSAVEHPSVRSGGRFPAACREEVPVTSDGIVDLAALRSRLAERTGCRVMVSIMLANNESGVIQPIAEAAEIVHSAGGVLHVDAVQGPGRIAVDMDTLGADLLTLSAHKLGGPKGTGALISRGRIPLEPAITGGGQERGLRAGTENVAGIAGFGAAAEATQQRRGAEHACMKALRDRLETGLRDISPQMVIFGDACDRLPNTTLFAVPGVKAETAVIALDLDGVAVSSGAACSSGKVQPSHVLAAMGIPSDLARGSIRVSIGHATTESEIARFLAAWLKFCGALHRGKDGIAA
jgi:cysteine desulfurase